MKRGQLLFLLFVFFTFIPALAQVDTAWVRRYHAQDNYGDIAFALKVDSTGNIYVTGLSILQSSSHDYATIKYSPTGDTIWVRRYNGPGNYIDQAFDLAVDDSGNVYVTGLSVGRETCYTEGCYDWATIKYSSNGDIEWVSRYDGSDNNSDIPNDLEVDGNGNVYVTGVSYWEISDFDYATIKYAPNGETLWVRTYNGPGNSVDNASSLALDKSGNVYVTGASVDSGTSFDFATLKYDPNGNILWERRYNGPTDSVDKAIGLALDKDDNVFVTGYSYAAGTYYDYLTIKYSSEGETLWVRRYNGPGNGGDYPTAIGVDLSGNLYVLGVSVGVGTNWDYGTIKYSPDGELLWDRLYNGPQGNGNDLARALAVDLHGNVYVTGGSPGLGTSWDYATVKYSPEGDALWISRYNGPPGNDHDEALALDVDGCGFVYITGNSWGLGTSNDYATIKYKQAAFKPGDANGDNKVDLQDIIFKVNYIFKGGLKPEPICRGDDNADGKVNLSDIMYEVNYIFKSGSAPVKIQGCCL